MYNSNEDIVAGSKGEWIVQNLCLGDNIIVPIVTYEPFWLMFVNKGAHVVVTSFKNVMVKNGQKGTLLCEAFGTDNYNQEVILTLHVMIKLLPSYFPI